MAKSSRRASREGPAGDQGPPTPLVQRRLPEPAAETNVEITRPTDLAGRTVYVVDANNLIYQVFHALPEMTSPRGEPVNAVFGFVRDILYLFEEKKPDFLVCAFDPPGKTFRHDMYDQYKIHRDAMPDDLIPQMPLIRQALDVLGVPVLQCKGFEADDVLATLAQRCDEQGADCLLVTADKDCRQSITDHVKIYNVRKDLVYDREALAKDWGIRPDQVVDFQALVGDSVDNVPGVRLIGPKIAAELLGKYDTLDEVLDRADEVAGAKRRQNLLEGREQALLSRDLVRLERNVPIEIDWNAARAGRIDTAAATELFRDLGFRRLTERMSSLASGGISTTWKADYRTIDTPQALDRFLRELAAQKQFSFDTETTNLSPALAELVGCSFAWNEGEAYYLPLRAPEGEPHLDLQSTIEALRPILEDPAIEKIGQNLKYDMVVLRTAGVHLAGVVFDTMVASYLLDAGARNHNLDELARRYLDHTTTKISDLIGKGRNQKRIDEVSVSSVAPYAGEDADIPLRLKPILAARLEQEHLEKLFRELELPLIEVLAELESNGIKVDVDRLGELSRRYGERMEELESQIYELAGHKLNIDSPKQLQEVLFTELKLPAVKRTKTGLSTDAEVLETLADKHPLPAKIIEYRQYAKLKNTYVDALPAMVNPRTGRVHASFHQAVAATGRLSSSNPNLQNIPIRTEEGREIRSAFLPGESGWLLLAADYSQIELRFLAHFSGDVTLCEAFQRDEDVHALVASEVYGVSLSEVTPAMRRSAKTVNFGVIYGQSPYGLARQLGIDQLEAARFIDAYFDRYAGVEKFLSKVLEECRERGYVSTIMGRKRAIHGIRAVGGRQRNLPERTAINTVIQGSAADLIKKAMIAIHHRLRQEELAARMLLQIHDELIFEVSSDQLDKLADLVAAEMSGVMDLRVPLKVDLKSGPTWADVETWN